MAKIKDSSTRERLHVAKKEKTKTNDDEVIEGTVEFVDFEEIDWAKIGKVEVQDSDLHIAIGVVYFLAPFVVAFVVLFGTGSTKEELGLLALWHVWCFQIAVRPVPFNTPRGFTVAWITLIGGIYIANQFRNSIIKQQYIMASIMFSFGRGNALSNDPQLRSLPFSFRLAYLFSFQDLGKLSFCSSRTEYDRVLSGFKRGLKLTVAGLLFTSVGLILSTHQKPESMLGILVKEIGKVILGSLNFIFGLYLGDAIYTLPFFMFSNHPNRTVRPQPLMIQPWRSQTLKEWWGFRFDTGMQSVLYYNAYRPVRKLGFGRGAATFATFFCSGAIHCPMIHGFGATEYELVKIFSFFLLQAILIGTEDLFRLGPSQFRTLALLGVSSPLFIFPVLRIMGHHP